MSMFSAGAKLASAAGTGISAGAELTAGSQAAALGQADAGYLRVQAGEEAAAGTIKAADDALSTKYIISQARGAAGASGAVATSSDVVGVEGQIAARGSYNALMDVYTAKDKAIGLNYQGALDIYKGQLEQRADDVKAISTVLTGAGSLAEKYGKPGGASSQSDTVLYGGGPSP